VVAVQILVVADAPYVIDQVTAALGGSDVGFTVVSDGRNVPAVIAERMPDLAVIDLQVGSMGGVAVTMAARLDESAGRHGRLPVLLLLDRDADVYLAKRCDADDYLVKPINALQMKRAALAIVNPPEELSRAAAAKRGRRAGEDAAEAELGAAELVEAETVDAAELDVVDEPAELR